MRKLLLSVITICLSTGLLSPVSADPGAAAYSEQIAWASWIDMHGKTGDYTGAIAWRTIQKEGLVTLAGVFKGKCRAESSKHFMMITCHGRGHGKEIPFQDFEMHPLMDSATLKLRAGGFANRVNWTGRGPGPVNSGGVAGGDKWVAAGTDTYRDAKTNGRVLGKSYKSSGWLDWGFMVGATGAAIDAGVDGWETENLDVDLAPDGTFTVDQTFRIRR